MIERKIDLSPSLGDEVKTTTCYMCACRCGIKVHLKDGTIRYIEGNREHPVNRGVLCAKGSAGIMQHYSPARLTSPLLRVGERGKAEFKEISWDEALALATTWLGDIRKTDPKKLAFFTGRDQSQALTGWWAGQFGTPNYAAHGGFCSVNMAVAGLYTTGGSFWEFGEPDWERSQYMLLFGVAEDHDSNPIKIGLSRLKARGVKTVSINPIRTGYSAVADEWLGITPGTDGLFIMALMHELLRAGKVDVEFLQRYSNAPHLVVQNPGGADDGLIARDAAGKELVWDLADGTAKQAASAARPALKGEFTVPDGRRAVPAFQLFAARCLAPEHAPDAVAERTGIDAATIRRIAAELAYAAFEQAIELDIPWTDHLGRHHAKTVGRPVAMHAMRGISAHSNGFHTCRSLHMLQLLLGSIDVPGGHLYKAPYPKPLSTQPRPWGRPDQIAPGKSMPGSPLGFPRGPEDLVIDGQGRPQRIDKAFSWDAPLAAHGMLHTVITNACKGDPYEIDTLFLYMANMAWNSAMNTTETMNLLTSKREDGEYKLPRIIYSDAYFSEMVAYADLVLPDTTYLERWDCLSLLDRPISRAEGPADSIRQPVLEPDRDVRPFQDVLLDLGVRLALPGLVREDKSARFPGSYADYLVHHERRPGVGNLAGWRGADGTKSGRGEPNENQLQAYIDHGCYWHHEWSDGERYYRFANQAYLTRAVEFGLVDAPSPVTHQLYCEELQRFRLAAQGHGPIQPPAEHRTRVATYFDPLPLWYAPLDDSGPEEFRIHALTQRPMAMYHAWGSQNAWLRQIHGWNRLYVPAALARRLKVVDDDWVWLTSRNGRVRGQVRVMDGVNPHTVWTWNAIGKRAGAWNLAADAEEATKGFLLNHLIDDLLPAREGQYRYANADPVTGQAAWFDLRIKIEKIDQPFDNRSIFSTIEHPKDLPAAPHRLRYGAKEPAS
ncbi:MAG: molybdopterin oxidoreductase family protein [Alphaproteobacteria bacterium]